MILTEYLSQEWIPALGCTEPASIALAAATAGEKLTGKIKHIKLIVDPKIYKNCYAVGIPGSDHKTGILWAVAIGAQIQDTSLGLECFENISKEMISIAKDLIDKGAIEIDVDTSHDELFIDCNISKDGGFGRAVIADEHTNIIRTERNGETLFEKTSQDSGKKSSLRKQIASMSIESLISLAHTSNDEDCHRLREGIAMNSRISEHGLKLFPKRFVELSMEDTLSRMSTLVCAGVYARMWGESIPVMSLAGSGNKGITAAVPISIYGKKLGLPQERIDKSLALACLITSATTHHLGTLSAVCGCSNAAGIGLSAGLVLLEGGGEKEISLAINNMVGNVTGMICDGAKIGCALKTMAAVDSAFRACTLAMSGMGIPACDGIIGDSGLNSLKNLGRIATRGMISTDSEILEIMQEKLK
ncbi:MAG: serine dehydratase subunit alpha family protein [Deltaproteobacteria bacterium]|jgi:L-cysteine desulfidase|nr:serine dehydratase subunit alpha family protein [Deltaproteobacteria bacterium]